MFHSPLCLVLSQSLQSLIDSRNSTPCVMSHLHQTQPPASKAPPSSPPYSPAFPHLPPLSQSTPSGSETLQISGREDGSRREVSYLSFWDGLWGDLMKGGGLAVGFGVWGSGLRMCLMMVLGVGGWRFGWWFRRGRGRKDEGWAFLCLFPSSC